jgi:hypothetical protein
MSQASTSRLVVPLVVGAVTLAIGFVVGRRGDGDAQASVQRLDDLILRVTRLETAVRNASSTESASPTKSEPAQVDVQRTAVADDQVIQMLNELREQLNALSVRTLLAPPSTASVTANREGLKKDVDAKNFDARQFAARYFCWRKADIYSALGVPDNQGRTPDGTTWDYRAGEVAGGQRWVSFKFVDGVVVNVDVVPQQ